MLPNLSSLSLPRREEEVRLPLSENLPKFSMRGDTSAEEERFLPKLAFVRFQTGAVFSAVNGSIIYRETSFAQQIFRSLADLSESQLQKDSFSSGTFNRAEKISEKNLASEPNDLKREILQLSSTIAGKKLNSVVLRTSKARSVHASLSGIHNGSYTAMLDAMFQELMVSLFAARSGVGPDIYFAKVIKTKYTTKDGKKQYVPRVVYATEAADSSLEEACKAIGYSMSQSMSSKLFSVMQRAADIKLMLLDIKTPNIVVFSEDKEFRDVKLIDFATDYATIIPKSEPYRDEIMYINTCMLCFYVGTENTYKDEDRKCLLPVMNDLYAWLKLKQRTYDSGVDGASVLIKNLQAKRWADVKFENFVKPPDMHPRSEAYTLLDANTDKSSIERIIFAVVNHYALQDVDMNDPNNHDAPLLFRSDSFDPDKPLFPQLVRNFLSFYELLHESNPSALPPLNESRKRELSSPKSRRELSRQSS